MSSVKTILKKTSAMKPQEWIDMVNMSGHANAVFGPKNISAIFSHATKLELVHYVLDYMAQNRFNDFMALGDYLFTFTKGGIKGPKIKFNTMYHYDLWPKYLLKQRIKNRDINGLMRDLNNGKISFVLFRFNCIDFEREDIEIKYFMVCFLKYKFNIRNKDEKDFVDSTINEIFVNCDFRLPTRLNSFEVATKVVCDVYGQIKCHYIKNLIHWVMRNKYANSWVKAYVTIGPQSEWKGGQFISYDPKIYLDTLVEKVYYTFGKFEITELPQRTFRALADQKLANILARHPLISYSFHERPVEVHCPDDIVFAEKIFTDIGKDLTSVLIRRDFHPSRVMIKRLIQFAVCRNLRIYTNVEELVKRAKTCGYPPEVDIDKLAYEIMIGKYTSSSAMCQVSQ